ncbi:sensor histidine kinase [Roseimaritima ulvae]|nr:ATP-binding protein [Roseimaritima ulvae]
MQDASLLLKLNRILLAGHAVMLVVFAALILVGGYEYRWGAFAASSLSVLVSWAICMIGARRAVMPVLTLVGDLTRENDRLAAGKPAQSVTTELEFPFNRLVESQARMRSRVNEREQRLQTEFERLSAVLNSMHDGVVAVDRQEKVLLANATSRQMVHFVTGEATGKPFLEVSRNWLLCESLRNCLVTGRMQRREIQTADEPVRTLDLRASCLPGSPPQGAVAVLRDVTELRRLENLRHEFVANVSHELKTPLAAIMAYAETLKMGAINDQENNLNFVHRIEEQAKRLHQLIQDILQIARVESGQEVFHIVRVPLHDAITAAVAVQRDSAEHKQQTLTVDIQESAVVDADEDGVRTIIDNLLSNAIKYTPAGGHVTVRLATDGQQARVEVEDTGIGISAENLPRVFERFFRADRARARSMISTGLGLSIVKHLSQAFGGSVSVTSQLGEGSCFVVKLPLGE